MSRRFQFQIGHFFFQLKISDCWVIDNKPVRFLLEPLDNPKFPEYSGFRIVLVWLAVWVIRMPQTEEVVS